MLNLTPERVKGSLTETNIDYILIWDRFIASQMEPAIYDTMSVDISAGEYLFRASGSRITFKGFLAL